MKCLPNAVVGRRDGSTQSINVENVFREHVVLGSLEGRSALRLVLRRALIQCARATCLRSMPFCSIVTIGPMVLFCLLGITFFFGSRERHVNPNGRVIPSSEASSSLRHSHPFQNRSDLESNRAKGEGHGVTGPRSIPGENLDVDTLTPAFDTASKGERKADSKEAVQAPGSLRNLTEESRRGRRSRRSLLRAESGEERDTEQV